VEKFLTYLVAVGVAGAGLFNILYSWLSHHPGRYLVVQEYLPLGVIRSTWLLSIFTGLTLLFLGWGLAKRKRRAWFFALVALALAAGAHLTKGLDYDAAFVNLVLLMVLLLLRHSYTVASDPASLGRSLLVSGTLFLTLYVYGLFGFYLLDRHFGARFDLIASAREAGRVLFTGSYPSRFPRTHRGRWFLDSLWYTVVGNIAVALGDPVGPPTEAQEVIGEFRDFCHRHDWYPVFFQVTEEFLPSAISPAALRRSAPETP
jgi:phosphatidylglycerol lysyltransferase